MAPSTDAPLLSAAGPGQRPDALAAMLAARSIALVGASPRAGTFGQRMTQEVTRSPSRPRVHLVNPRYARVAGQPCHPSLADVPRPVDLVLLGVRDGALEEQLTLAAGRGDRSAVIFGNAHEDPAAGGNQPPLRERLAGIARAAGMELCGAGCMGFVNASAGLRAIGYTEASPLPAGPVALVTHSGSVFSALLRARRGLRFSLAVSSGQELVTAAPAYLEYALGLPQTQVLALVLEAMRDAGRLRRVLASAAQREIPVVLLTVGGSAAGQAMVTAHSGALAAADGGWEALCRAYGVHRVSDLAELADTLELFAIGRRQARTLAQAASTAGQPADRTANAARKPADLPDGGAAEPGGATGTLPGRQAAGPRPDAAVPDRGTPATVLGIATVHDSGLERAHVADLADELGVPFAPIAAATTEQLSKLLDPGLLPTNPLDVWGTGAETRALFAACLTALAGDPSVAAVALAVDLVHELDGDLSYPLALADTAARTGKPLAVLSNLASAIDQEVARLLRAQGIPVLEGTRTGLLALRHLLDHARPRHLAAPAAGVPASAVPEDSLPAGERPGDTVPGDPVPRDTVPGDPVPGTGASSAGGPGSRWLCPERASKAVDPLRQRRGRELLAAGVTGGAPLLRLLREYGIDAVAAEPASDADAALATAAAIGYPVVLKTDQPAIAHKSDVGGVLLGIADPAALMAGYADLAGRLGPRVLVCQTAPAGPELALGITRDPGLGPLIVVGAGGVLVEMLADRAVALPPVDERLAAELVAGLRVSKLLAGARGAPPAALGPVVRAISGLSQLARELGDDLEALDVNPLICGPAAALAADALAIPAVASSGGARQAAGDEPGGGRPDGQRRARGW